MLNTQRQHDLRSVLIIGGGYSGLFTGAMLAKEGVHVTVLEKNKIPGGGLQCFPRCGTVFETGMHIVGGFQKGGTLQRICNYLGIADQVNVLPTDSDAAYTIAFKEDNAIYHFPRGRKATTAFLKERFPHEAAGIEAYVEELYALVDELSLLHLRDESHSILDKSDGFLSPASDFIARHITDAHLQHLLAHFSPLYGGARDQTPAYIHAVVSVLFIEGMAQFVGGSQQMADSLMDIIIRHGGEVVCGEAVAHIAMSDGLITGVTTMSGRQFNADQYISAVHPCVLLEMLPKNALPEAFCRRLDCLPNSTSCFCVFIRFKRNAQPYVNRPFFLYDTAEDVWNLDEYSESSFPKTALCFMPPTSVDCKWADRMIVNCPMPFSAVDAWKDSRWGHRGEDYKNWKQRLTEKVLQRLEEYYPGIRDRIECMFSSSPLTIRDFYGTKDGAMYGYQHDSHNILISQISPKTKIPNLFLTGQNISLHGICGVPLAAILTIEAMLGMGYITRKINEQQKQSI